MQGKKIKHNKDKKVLKYECSTNYGQVKCLFLWTKCVKGLWELLYTFTWIWF